MGTALLTLRITESTHTIDRLIGKWQKQSVWIKMQVTKKQT